MTFPTKISMVKVKLHPKFLFLFERAKIKVKIIYIPFTYIQVGHTVTFRVSALPTEQTEFPKPYLKKLLIANIRFLL